MNPIRKLLVGGSIAAAALIGGAVGASFIGAAGAQTSTTQAPAASTTAPDQGHRGADGTKGPHQANGITETLLTGNDLTKATSAAQAAVPGGTVVRAETDADGDKFEVHVTKADGSEVTVKLDGNFVVTKTAAGKG
jgi:hypothetical protein